MVTIGDSGKSMNRPRNSGFKSQLSYWLAVWPWANYSTPLSFSFLFCKWQQDSNKNYLAWSSWDPDRPSHQQTLRMDWGCRAVGSLSTKLALWKGLELLYSSTSGCTEKDGKREVRGLVHGILGTHSQIKHEAAYCIMHTFIQQAFRGTRLCT